MRDVATLVWVVLIIVGVVSSIISTARKQMQGAAAPRPPRTIPRRPQFLQMPQAAVPPAQPAPPAPPPRPRPAPPPAHPFIEAPRESRRRFFGRKGDLVRAVIASEVLGKPKALTDEPFRY